MTEAGSPPTAAPAPDGTDRPARGRGHLRIYLGAAPGVGKTFAMLDEAHRRRRRGTDVVAGLVEARGRPLTAEQVGDLEVVPARLTEVQGRPVPSLDVDAILARRPAVALVDDLSEPNPPGSSNAWRWQDIDVLLDAGIDVISAVNISHLESLGDLIEQITGRRAEATVPDAWIRSADQVELVDMTPEALRRRLAHGNVVAAGDLDAAGADGFRPERLAALREVALVWMADQAEVTLEGADGDDLWQGRERILVALTGAPGGEDLVRRAARTAMRTRGELIGVHVTSSGRAGRSDDGLTAQRAVLERLGGRYVEVAGRDVAGSLVAAARAEHAGRIVVGASRRSRWREAVDGSIVNDLLRAAGGSIEVDVVGTSAFPGPSRRRRLRPASLPRRRQLTGAVLAAVALPAVTAAMVAGRSSLGLQNAVLLYLLAVLIIATVGGRLAAVPAAVASFALLTWFFTPPLHTLAIRHGRDVLTLVTFVAVAVVVSTLADQAARRRHEAHRARSEAEALGTAATVLMSDPDPLPRMAGLLADRFGLAGVTVFGGGAEAGWSAEAGAGDDPPATPEDADRTIDLDDRSLVAWNGRPLPAAEQAALSAVAAQLAVAVRTRRLAADAASAASLAEADEVRTSLLASVSHDLRTPLASIRTSATSLLAGDVDLPPEVVRALLETIDSEAGRLDAVVANLLDMTRVQVGHVGVTMEVIGVDEVVAQASVGLSAHPSRLRLDVAEDLPRVRTDPALLERAVANLLDNALRYSPEHHPVVVDAARVGDRLHLRVIDTGPGIRPDDRPKVLQPFQRAEHAGSGAGVGLGLAVADGFVRAVGADLTIEDTPGGGTTMVVALPLAEGS